MPLVNLKVIEGIFSQSQKHEMVRKLTDAVIAVAGENLRPVTTVIIDEVKSGDWAMGGNPITTEHVKEIAAGKPKS
jgi:4-oxalocrotonate tautomerase